MRILFVIAVILTAVLLWTIPAKAQDCFSVQKSLIELNTYTKENDIEAEAYLYQSPRDARIELLFVWFATNPEQVYVSAFREGCMVLMSDNTPGRMAPLTPQVTEAIGQAKQVFSNTDNSPFQYY